MSGYDYLLKGLTESNCNHRIDTLRDLQSNISKKYTYYYDGIAHMKTDDLIALDNEYNCTCDIMDELLKFRRSHNCAIKGDPEYSAS